MTESLQASRDRISRAQVDKFSARRTQLATAALHTLAELGYARTSLREIAQNSEFSHGVLHYYFRDKDDLLTESVRQYEAMCVTRYDEIVANAVAADELCHDFGLAISTTLREDAQIHRLWYDLRSQSLFVESFRADVVEIDQRRQDMIWNVARRYAELLGTTPAISPAAVYALFDGLFQQSLLHFLAGRSEAVDTLRAAATDALRSLAPVTHVVMPSSSLTP